MNIDITKKGQTLQLTIQGSIGEKEADILKQRFRENSLDDVNEVILDMDKVTHLGSSGIGKLILIYKDITFKSGQLKLINTPPGIYESLIHIKFDKIFSISKS